MDTYNAVTGYNLTMTTERMLALEAWWTRGFTGSDMCLVIRHIQYGIKCGKRNEGALKFEWIVSRPDWFEQELGMARAETRQRKHTTPKERVLQQARPCVCEHKPDEPCTARSSKELIDDLKRAAGMNV